MKRFKTIFNRNKYFFLFLILLLPAKAHSQSPLDSLEIYNPFSQVDDIRRIVKTRLSILSGENKTLINKYDLLADSAKKTGDIKKETDAYFNAGDIFFKSALYNVALDYYIRALERFVSINDSIHAAFSQIKIGRTYYFSDLPGYDEHINNGYEVLKNCTDKELRAYANYAKGTIETNNSKAAAYYKLALRLQEEIIKFKPDDYTANENYSRYLSASGNVSKALAIASKIDNKWLQVLYINNIAYDKAFQGQYKEAIGLFKRSLVLSKAGKLKGLLRNTYVNLSITYRLMGNWEKTAYYREIAAYIIESLYTDEFTIQMSQMKAKYNMQKNEFENIILKKEKAIMLDNIDDKVKQNYILIISLIVLALFSLYFFISRRKIRNANLLLDNQKNEIQAQKESLELLNEELKNSEENLNIAQNSAQLANWEWDFQNDKLSFSKELPNIYDVDVNDLKLNFRETVLKKILPEDSEQFSNYFITGKKGYQNEEREYRIIRNNEVRWIKTKRKVICDENENPQKVFGTVQDITEIKKAEQARYQFEMQLAFTKQLIQSQEEERKRIAGELHDGLGQDILLIKNRAQTLLKSGNLDNAISEQLDQINQATMDILNLVREISFNLRPAHLERLGLTETILSMVNKVSQNYDIKFKSKADNIDELFNNDAEINIFRIFQEAFNNIIKHSNAKNAYFEITRNEKDIRINISDDGKGFNLNEKQKSKGFGLNNILNRVKILNGEIKILTDQNKGTKINLIIPVS